MPTFAEVAGRVIAFRRPTWKSAKHAAQWESTLSAYAYPVVGSRPVGEITSSDVPRVLTPIWNSKAETAQRRPRLGRRPGLPLRQPRRRHLRSPAQAVPRRPPPRRPPLLRGSPAVRRVWDSGAMPVTKLAFEFLVLTATRSGDV